MLITIQFHFVMLSFFCVTQWCHIVSKQVADNDMAFSILLHAHRLKRCRILPEREARTVLMQIISGLRYLNTPGDTTGGGTGLGEEDGAEATGSGSRRKAIIHYDLKPGTQENRRLIYTPLLCSTQLCTALPCRPCTPLKCTAHCIKVALRYGTSSSSRSHWLVPRSFHSCSEYSIRWNGRCKNNWLWFVQNNRRLSWRHVHGADVSGGRHVLVLAPWMLREQWCQVRMAHWVINFEFCRY